MFKMSFLKIMENKILNPEYRHHCTALHFKVDVFIITCLKFKRFLKIHYIFFIMNSLAAFMIDNEFLVNINLLCDILNQIHYCKRHL